ncbi:riboflavin synthase [Leptolyngbya sp. NIES-2104]|uniref:riboflavin synthase n=1 Tax=Leptolyngbya sp. NIES-2104 TaxID=1552121 RepID=UPI0006EC4F4B|nr:riboflavin synthase [Leptolyngbya sp. NIES-2104]GAP96253.1 riboflavin synthase eubacterial/eukaryotic [Leptolyngbya sp. NIES-2104]
MFTGLVQTVGRLVILNPEQVRISGSRMAGVLQGLELGDSVAVDGVCLTVTEISEDGFVADVSPETVNRTTLGQSAEGAKSVNLETSLRVGSKLGGHFVTGHVDGIGTFESATQTATSWEILFKTESEQVARYILPKGSISVNGISLTIANCAADGSWFTVAVIPHTYAETNLSELKPGDWVNLEGDILGKYVEKFLRGGRSGVEVPDRISTEFLAEHGYF